MGGACCSRAKRQANHSIDAKSSVCSAEWEFPMYMVPISELLSMSGPPQAHQVLREQGKIVVWQRGRTCVFLSHQWLSFRHPDPEGKQLLVAREAIRKLVSGELKMQTHPGVDTCLPKKIRSKWGMNI